MNPATRIAWTQKITRQSIVQQEIAAQRRAEWEAKQAAMKQEQDRRQDQ